jgi:hypothetical protein
MTLAAKRSTMRSTPYSMVTTHARRLWPDKPILRAGEAADAEAPTDILARSTVAQADGSLTASEALPGLFGDDAMQVLAPQRQVEREPQGHHG